MMKKRHILHWAMGVIMTPLLGSCAYDELSEIAGGGNNVLSFGVEVNAGAPEVKPMGGATRSVDKSDSISPGNAVMSPDVDGFFPTSSVELSSVDGKTLYANCDERSGINMHNNVDYQITRGTIQTNDIFYSSFALYGYVYDSGKTWANDGSSTNVDSNINGITMSKNGTGSDYNASGVYWPGASKKATFFAVAPKNCSGASITANSGGPQIIYTVPQTVSNQEDLLVAVAKDVTCDGKKAPSLTFNHALAAIKFEKGTLADYTSISKVEISGVYNKGELSSFDDPAWSGQSIDGTVTNTYSISDLSNVMFLMSQTTPTGAKLKVTFKNDTEEKTFEADLNGTSWQAGHQYTYKLSVNKITGTFKFEVSPSTTSIAITGGTATFTVKSYYQYQDNTTTAIPWSGSYTVGDTPTPVYGTGGNTGETISFNIPQNEPTSTHTQVLQNNPVKGSKTSPYDLSTNGGASSMNTANCYVVNSQGTYSIPLVYGCAIKNGQENTIAYGKGTYEGKTYNSKTFKRHDDNQISSPYLKDNGITVNGAELLWQEVKGMITEVNVQDGKVVFTIGDKIAQGNALIAAKYGSTIVWSWHIWVTDRDIYATVPIQTVALTSPVTSKKTYNFMPVPLGWVDQSEDVSSRTFTVTLIQPQSNKTLTATANQAGQSTLSGTCPYYQWGRKDPFCPSDGTTSNMDKTLYDSSGNSFTMTQTKGRVKTGTSIKNPATYYYYSSDPCDWNNTTYYDYWNATNGTTTSMNDNVVVKTVYDPNPVGFKMPSPDAFTGFTDDGGSLLSSLNNCIDKTNGYTNGFNEGYNFYTNSNKTTTTYWRACGYRSYQSGSLGGVGSFGIYWSAGPHDNKYGHYVYLNSNSVIPQHIMTRASGGSVRSVSEQ